MHQAVAEPADLGDRHIGHFGQGGLLGSWSGLQGGYDGFQERPSRSPDDTQLVFNSGSTPYKVSKDGSNPTEFIRG